MRIGFVAPGSLSEVSGGYLYDRKLVEHLRSRGDRVDVISLSHGPSSRSLGRLLECGTWDVVVEDELAHASLCLLPQRKPSRRRTPIVSIVHHLRSREHRAPWQNFLSGAAERVYFAGIDAFICTSAATRRDVREILGGSLPSLLAYPGRDHRVSCVDESRALARALRPGPLRIIFIGNVIPRKGLHVLLEAFSRIHDAHLELEVVGSLEVDRPYAASLVRFVAARALGDRVRFRGKLSDDTAAALLAESHLCAVPSYYEGLGIVYLEALGSGVPVIASSAGGGGEVVRNFKEGFLVAPGDPMTLTYRIRQLALDREYLAEMSANALLRFRDFPTWQESGEAVRRFLAGIRAGEGFGAGAPAAVR